LCNRASSVCSSTATGCATRWIRRTAETGVLDLRNLTVEFDTPDGVVRAVNGVSLNVAAGDCLGIVGGSVSGKSQTFLAAMGLLAKNGRTTGTATFEGQTLLGRASEQANRIRGSKMTMIFEDPLWSLTPHMRIGDQMREVLETQMGRQGEAALRTCLDRLGCVRIPEAARRLRQYPHELSGGRARG
jgi:ABC-type dipeptide/oligopeptide/nickel transport system ATPase component